MKDTTDMKYEYILSFVCDHLCKYPDIYSNQEEFDSACDRCALIDYLADLEESEAEK